jgi:hypothetical protein
MERDRWKDLERELHAARSEPPDALVARITARLRVARTRRRPLLRLAAAAVLTAGVLAVFAGLGAVDEAAGAAAKVAQVARALAGPPEDKGNQGQGQGQGNQGNQGNGNEESEEETQDEESQAGEGGEEEQVEASQGGGAEKTTICHRTGSETNPWVEITVSNNALPAHTEHGDIIPAPATGCPPPDADDGDDTGDDGYPEKTAICHRTRSDTNPYVLIVISNNAIPAHQKHDDPPDIIPAPATGCPTTAP